MTDMSRVPRRMALGTSVLALGLALAACGAKKHETTQAAARVDGAEITVHQINYRLQRERGLKPEQMDEAGRKVLEQLIDEQLVVEKAEKEKVDKDPLAEQAMGAARREILARAYVEQAAQGVPAPADDALHRYFDDNEALFAKRRIYTLQEFLAQVPLAKLPALQALVDAGKPVAEVESWLKQQGVPFRGQQGVHPAEQIPLGSLKQLAAQPDGRGILVSNGSQVHVTYIVSSTTQPVSFDQAKPAIAQFLLTDARRKATEGNLAALRSAAKIQYMPPYEALAAAQPAALSTKDIDAKSQVQAASGTRVSLPAAGVSSSTQVSLPTATAPGVRISLPASAASSVEVRLPSQTGGSPDKK